MNFLKLLLLVVSIIYGNSTFAVDSTSAVAAANELNSMDDLRKMEAEIAKRIEEENNRPRIKIISPSTKEIGYSMYYVKTKERIEKFGTLNFPQKNGKKIYGELVLSISIYQDGRIYDADGKNGIVVDRSSGDPDLDAAAKRIVRRAAPFQKFTESMRSIEKNDVLIMIARFKFINDEFAIDLPSPKD